MITAYKKFWMNYAKFDGRTGRSEFWLAVIMNAIIITATIILMFAICELTYDFNVAITMIVVFILYSVAIVIPTLALAVRRLHDIGKSGGYIFFALIPLVGSIFLLVWYCTSGDPEKNIYGESPSKNGAQSDYRNTAGYAMAYKYEQQSRASSTYQKSQNSYPQGVSKASPLINTAIQENTPKCPQCGTLATGAFCSNCGFAMKEVETACPQCGTLGSSKFCSNCGASRK